MRAHSRGFRIKTTVQALSAKIMKVVHLKGYRNQTFVFETGEIIMANINAMVIVGYARLTRDIKWFENANGSRTGLVNVAIERDYTDKEGNRPVDFVDFKVFVGKDQKPGAIARVGQGSPIAFTAEIRSSKDEKKNEYHQDLVIDLYSVQFRESKSSAEARRTKEEAPEAAPAVVEEAPASTEVTGDPWANWGK